MTILSKTLIYENAFYQFRLCNEIEQWSVVVGTNCMRPYNHRPNAMG